MPKSFPENWALRRQPKTADRVAAWVIVAGMLLLGPCCLRADGEMIEDGEYVIYIFRANGTFTPPTGVSHVEVLVVAGGGGGGGSNASNVGSGGGGGGGVLYETAYAVAGPVMVTVGNGGGGGVGTSRGTQGGNSVFGALTAIGGGGGGAPGGQVDGGSGGSGGGGGGANPASTGGAGGQGNAGGRGRRQGNGQGYGGGGGGRNAAGGDGFGMAGNGGGGSTYLNFAAFGDGGFFAGGGGGGRGGLGGIGGGGAGGPYNGSAGSPGDANTGGGGGGSAGNPGAAGGSGIVLVRYMATTSVWLTGDVMLNFGDNIAQPGDWQDNVINATSQIHWNSIVNPGAYHKITVRLSDGTLPAGLQLKVYCTRAAGELVLNNTVQNFITGIGNEATTLPLRYTLVVTDVAALFAQVTPLIIEYTIESQ